MDTKSKESRSENMRKILSQGNLTTEIRFIKLLRNHKISGWRRNIRLSGKPDFVFPAVKLAVFIDGDFWHGNPAKFRLPKSNLSYWTAKIARNQQRDRQVTRTLKKLGWKVLRIWESSLKHEVRVVSRLRKKILE